MNVRDLVAELGKQDPELDVRLSAFSPVAGMTVRPEYDGPPGAGAQAAGQYLELLPDGLPEGTGC